MGAAAVGWWLPCSLRGYSWNGARGTPTLPEQPICLQIIQLLGWPGCRGRAGNVVLAVIRLPSRVHACAALCASVQYVYPYVREAPVIFPVTLYV